MKADTTSTHTEESPNFPLLHTDACDLARGSLIHSCERASLHPGQRMKTFFLFEITLKLDINWEKTWRYITHTRKNGVPYAQRSLCSDELLIQTRLGWVLACSYHFSNVFLNFNTLISCLNVNTEDENAGHPHPQF